MNLEYLVAVVIFAVLSERKANYPVIFYRPMSASQQENATLVAQIGAGCMIDGPEGNTGRKVAADSIANTIVRVLRWLPDPTSRRTPVVEVARVWSSKIDCTLRPGGTSYREFARLMSRF